MQDRNASSTSQGTSQRSTVSRLIASLLLCLLLFGVLAQQVISRGPLIGFDRPLERFAVASRTNLLTDVMRALSQVGSTVFLLPLILLTVVYLIFRDRDWRPPAVLVAAFVTDILLQDTVKRLVGRQRPPLHYMIGRYPGGSFPSGHTTQSFVVYGMIALLLIRTHPTWRRWPLLLAGGVLVLLIGASRVYLGAHWLTDVAGGLVLGSFWLVTLHALSPFLLPAEKRPRVDYEQSERL